MNKVIISVVGRDTVGIIAKVCTYLAAEQINVLDISQTILGGLFNMMMVVDCSNATVDSSKLIGDLQELGQTIGVNIHAQREEIFTAMHRV